jgi:hypothetical protein
MEEELSMLCEASVKAETLPFVAFVSSVAVAPVEPSMRLPLVTVN